MPTLYLNPYQYPIYLPVTTKGKQCVTRCYPPMNPFVHPHTGAVQQASINSRCAVAITDKNEDNESKQFGVCPFTTPVVDGWIALPVTEMTTSKKSIYKAILANNFNIHTYKQYKLWKSTTATDAHTKKSVEWMAKLVFKKKISN